MGVFVTMEGINYQTRSMSERAVYHDELTDRKGDKIWFFLHNKMCHVDFNVDFSFFFVRNFFGSISARLSVIQ